MATFESGYKKKLKESLQNASGLKAIVADGLAYKIDNLLAKSASDYNCLFALITNGGGTKSNVPGVDITSVDYYLTYACFQQNLETVLSALYEIANENNSACLTLNSGNKEYKYRAVYGVPKIERSIDKSYGEGIEKLVLISQPIRINYGANAWVDSARYIFKINETEYPLNGVIRVETAFDLAYDTYQKKGASRQSEELQSAISGWVFTLMTIESDTFQALMREYLYAQKAFSRDTFSLIEVKNGSQIETPIKTLSFTTTFENNVGTSTLSLKY